MLLVMETKLTNREIGTKVAQFRKEAGLSQVQLAEKLGVVQSAVASYEIGRRSIPVTLLLPLSETLGVPVQAFFGLPENASGKPGPESRLEQKIQQLKRLPRSQQTTVLKMLEGLL
jgi:transcriptional regulator with XRE-family HTH domain